MIYLFLTNELEERNKLITEKINDYEIRKKYENSLEEKVGNDYYNTIMAMNNDRERIKILTEEIEELKKMLRIDKIKNEQKQQENQPSDPLCDGIFYVYPEFKKHYPFFKSKEDIKKADDGLRWHYSKVSLAEYFDSLKCNDEKRKWVEIENLFYIKNDLTKVKNLRQALYDQREKQRKPSIDFEKIQQLLETLQ
jgi:hypothetical protein